MIEAQAFLAAIIDTSDDAIVTKDLNGTITSWNLSAERIFGYKASEVIGRNIDIIIPPDHIDEEDYILNNIKQGIRIDHFESIRRHKDGRLINISVTISPIRNAQGTIIGASKVARDITELKQADRINAYYKAIVDSSNDAIISKDLDGYIASWNSAAEKIFGFKADEMVGRHITSIIPAHLQVEETNILAQLRSGKRIEHFETKRLHKQGHLIPVSLTVSPIFDKRGNIIGASKISRDISERLKAEQALLEITQNKDAFLANISHELRTPMNAVIGLTSILQRSDSLTVEEQHYLKVLKDSADTMLVLINDLLDFAKMESGAVELEAVEFVLSNIVEQVVSVTGLKATEKNLDLNVSYDSEAQANFLGDPLRIQQVLTNLLANAIKFTEQGSVTLELTIEDAPEKDTSIAKIIISDTGIGIPEDKIATIFDKFSQADTSVARRFGGSGLGLSISKALTEMMDGTIEVQSKAGEGSSFIVTLPVKRAEPTSTTDDAEQEAELCLQKHVMLAEDYQANILVATIMLEQLGCSYDVVNNGLEALEKFSTKSYDVILMDVQMAELDGLEASRQIRQKELQEGLARTPIIAMTAHAHDEYKKKCIDSGMDDFISKPIDPAVLAEKIISVLN